MAGSRFHWSLVAISSVSAIALAFFLIPPLLGVEVVHHWGYFVILAAFLAFCLSLYLTVRQEGTKRWRSVDRTLLTVAVIATILWQTQEPHGFKVLMDELVLNGTAMSIHFDREVFVPLKVHEIDGLHVVLGGLLDKRPLFFPFLLSLLHDISGYRSENAFVLNALLSFLLLLVAGQLGHKLGGTRQAGVLVILLLAGLPLLSLNATGGGLEILNLLLIAVVTLFGIRFLEHPRADNQNNLILATVLLAQTRYESALFIVATALILLTGWWRNQSPIFSWGLVGAPFFLITIPLQNKLFQINPGYWQVQGPESPFHPQYFSDNVGHAMNFLFTVDQFSTASPILSGGGVVCLLFALVYLLRRWRQTLRTPTFTSYAVVAIVILANLGLLLCYFWGQLDDYVATRLALPLLLLFGLSCAFVLGRWVKSTPGWVGVHLIAGMWLAGWAIPISSSARSTHAFLTYQEVEWQREFISSTHESAFYVMHSSLPAITLRRAAIPIEVVNERARELEYHLNAGTYDSVYLFQRLILDPNTNRLEVAPGFELGPEFVLEPIDERRFKPLYAMRLSKIVAIDLSRQLPKPPDWKPKFPPFKVVPEADETATGAYLREYLQLLP